MANEVVISREAQIRKVKWTSSDESEPIQLMPGSAWALYLPSGSTITSVAIKGRVKHTDADIDVDNYFTFATGGTDLTTVVAADKINELDKKLFAGLSEVKIVAQASVTEVGILLVAT